MINWQERASEYRKKNAILFQRLHDSKRRFRNAKTQLRFYKPFLKEYNRIYEMLKKKFGCEMADKLYKKK